MISALQMRSGSDLLRFCFENFESLGISELFCEMFFKHVFCDSVFAFKKIAINTVTVVMKADEKTFFLVG
jgi:hypothetical protein